MEMNLYGLQNSPGLISTHMIELLKDDPEVLSYIDDIYITDDVTEHLKKVDPIVIILASSGYKIH